jgi:hypothetical protein
VKFLKREQLGRDLASTDIPWLLMKSTLHFHKAFRAIYDLIEFTFSDFIPDVPSSRINKYRNK